MQICIMGVEYEIKHETIETDPELKGLDGYVDWKKKIIVLNKDSTNATLRHEIIHAYLHESGLSYNSGSAEAWAVNEEMVDWFALQLPKIAATLIELECLYDTDR